jgi:glycolate oxidase
VTEATLKLYPRPAHATTVLAPFTTLDEVTKAVPRVVASGIGPLIVEYIDLVTMSVVTANIGLDLGIPEAIKEQALAYLVIVLEDRRADRLEENTEELALMLGELGAMDVYVLPPHAGGQLIEAREKAFWVAKANNADDVLDMVVPRAQIADLLTTVADLSAASGSWIVGCGHAGDGNVHLSVFQGDAEVRYDVIRNIFAAAMDLGGAISGEHGIGRAKKKYFLELEDPAKIALMQRIKAAFDPNGIMNPGILFD